MTKCKALSRISTRENGVLVLFEKKQVLYVEDNEAKRLEKLGVVEILEHIEDQKEENEAEYLSEEVIRGMLKDDLVVYAEKIGMEVDERAKKDTIADNVCDYINEQKANA